jgi:hypothetical protein
MPKDSCVLCRLSVKGFMKRTILCTLVIAFASSQLGLSQTAEDLPRFDLDFPGGTPQELVDAIRDKSETLNAIIPVEHKNVHLPPLKMRSVNVAQLFEALSLASSRTLVYQTGFTEVPAPGGKPQRRAQLQERAVNYGFRSNGPVTPTTVWYFYNQDMPENFKGFQNVCRFYQLEPYLQKYKVDDITTAIQAGWKMLGQSDVPQLNYHEDTKLLIAVGREAMLDIIDSVLAQLTTGNSPAESAGARRKLAPEPEKKL